MEEIICISSDEEKTPKIHNGKPASNIPKTKETTVSDCGKRKVSSQATDNSTEKKAKLSEGSDKPRAANKDPVNHDFQNSKSEFPGGLEAARGATKSPLDPNDATSEKLSAKFKVNEGASTSGASIKKPQLVVGKRVPLVTFQPAEDRGLFDKFLNTCATMKKSMDMEKIVQKLKKRYERLDRSYRESESFESLLRKKIGLITNDGRRCFVHMMEINNEMKAREVKSVNGEQRVEGSESSEAVGSSAAVDGSVGETVEESSGMSPELSRHDRKKLRQLEVTMKRCENRIKKLEEAEVEFDDENDSHYMMLERYKSRMVDLYNKYCEMTGENSDAGRVYLRPKDLSYTPFPALNRAISSFVNAKIGSRSKHSARKRKAIMDPVVFPDYPDILSCVEKCTKDHNLGLDKRAQEKIAQNAFIELGEHLQRARKLDYWDTFSLYLEREDADPATENVGLAEKLRENKERGEERLSKVLEDFVKKEEEAAAAKQEAGSARSEEESENDESDKEDSDETDDDSDVEKEIVKEVEPVEEGEDAKDDEVALAEEAQSETDEVKEVEVEKNQSDKENGSGDGSAMAKTSDDCVPAEVDATSAELEEIEDRSPFCPSAEITEVVELEDDTATEPDPAEKEKPVITVEEEEERPVLRLRSFAKPPCFWKDSQETLVASPPSPSASAKNEPTKSFSPKKDGTIAVGRTTRPYSLALPPAKINCMIPSSLNGRSVINVKNVTNNYTVALRNQDAADKSPIKLANRQGRSVAGDNRRTVSVGYGSDKSVIDVPSLDGQTPASRAATRPAQQKSIQPSSPRRFYGTSQPGIRLPSCKVRMLPTRPAQQKSAVPSGPGRYYGPSVTANHQGIVPARREAHAVTKSRLMAPVSKQGQQQLRMVQRSQARPAERRTVVSATRPVTNRVPSVQQRLDTMRRPVTVSGVRGFQEDVKRFVKMSVSPAKCGKAPEEVIELT